MIVNASDKTQDPQRLSIVFFALLCRFYLFSGMNRFWICGLHFGIVNLHINEMEKILDKVNYNKEYVNNNHSDVDIITSLPHLDLFESDENTLNANCNKNIGKSNIHYDKN